MAKKIGGAAYQRQKGNKPVLAPFTPKEHEIIRLAVGTLPGHVGGLGRFVVEAALDVARARLLECEIDPEKIPK